MREASGAEYRVGPEADVPGKCQGRQRHGFAVARSVMSMTEYDEHFVRDREPCEPKCVPRRVCEEKARNAGFQFSQYRTLIHFS